MTLSDLLFAALYLLPLIIVMVWYVRRHRRHEAAHVATWQSSVEAGLTAGPRSLH
jgi:hypothetical protein